MPNKDVNTIKAANVFTRKVVLAVVAFVLYSAAGTASPVQQAANVALTGETYHNYRLDIMRRIYSRIIYPTRAIARNQQGTVVIRLALDQRGKLLDLNLQEASNHKLLNEAAMYAVKVSAPYHQIPIKLSNNSLEITVPINFRIPK